MRVSLARLGVIILLAVLAPAPYTFGRATSEQSTSSTASSSKKKKAKTASTSSRKSSSRGKRLRRHAGPRGQQKIDAQRASQIQEALIREHYLSGKPSGVWDAATQQAMQKYQADNGWQAKTTPDARALIKLGLGPDHDHLLNPETAMTQPVPAQNPGGTSASPPSSAPAVKSQR